MLSYKRYFNTQGLTLLETLLALAVGALVVVGTMVYYGTVSHGSNVTKAVADMNAIMGAYRDYATAYTVTMDTTIQVLQDDDLLPNSLIDPWGQYYSTTVTLSDSAPTTVTIQLSGLRGDNKQCTAIAQAVTPVASQVGGEGSCGFQYTL